MSEPSSGASAGRLRGILFACSGAALAALGLLAYALSDPEVSGVARERILWAFVAGLSAAALGLALLRARRASVDMRLVELAAALRESGSERSRRLRAVVGASGEVAEIALRVGGLIDELEASDQQLDELRERLAAEVQQRTSGLQAAKERAEDADRAKSRFLVNVSQQLRTPLSGILGTVDLLRETRLVRRQSHLVDMLQSSAEALLALVSDILDFTRIEAGALELQQVEFSPQQVAEDALVSIAGRAQAKGLELISLIPRQVPPILRGDPHRFRQVLGNLLSNAVKFTAEGEIQLRMASGDPVDGRCLLVVEVEDSGCGVQAADRDGLFAALAGSGDERPLRGAGLGLALARQLAQRMGGDIEYRPALPYGSVFTARFGFEVAEAPAGGETSSSVPLKVAMLASSMRLRESLFGHARALGWEVAAFSRFADLEEARLSVRFDWAVVDRAIDDIDALAAISKLARAGLRVAALTRMNGNVEGDEAGRAGAETVLTKPLRRCDLARLAVGTGNPAGAQAGPHPRFDARVLLVEDHPVNLEIVGALLRSLGCRVVTASDGQQAFHAWAGQAFDLVLMDLQMPVMDGLASTRSIREAERKSQAQSRVPIVALTANALQDDREVCIQAGMDEYLSKPVSREHLASVLARLLPAGLCSATDAPAELQFAASLAEGPAEAPSGNLPAFSWEPLLLLPGVEGRRDAPLLRKVTQMFVSETEDALRRMRLHGDAGEWDEVRRLAHKTKSAAASVGAVRLGALATELDALIRAGRADAGAGLPARMEAAFRDYQRGLVRERLSDEATLTEWRKGA